MCLTCKNEDYLRGIIGLCPCYRFKITISTTTFLIWQERQPNPNRILCVCSFFLFARPLWTLTLTRPVVTWQSSPVYASPPVDPTLIHPMLTWQSSSALARTPWTPTLTHQLTSRR